MNTENLYVRGSRWPPPWEPGPFDPVPDISGLLDKIRMAKIRIYQNEMRIQQLATVKAQVDMEIRYLQLEQNLLREEHKLQEWNIGQP